MRDVRDKNSNGKAKGDAHIVAQSQTHGEKDDGREDGHGGNLADKQINLPGKLAVGRLLPNGHLGDLTEDAAVARTDGDAKALAIDDRRPAKGQIGCFQGVLHAALQAAILGLALSRDGRVVHLHLGHAEQATVGGDLVPRLEKDDIAEDNLGGGDTLNRLAADDARFGGHEGQEGLQNGRRLVLLVKVDEGVGEGHEEQNDPQVNLPDQSDG